MKNERERNKNTKKKTATITYKRQYTRENSTVNDFRIREWERQRHQKQKPMQDVLNVYNIPIYSYTHTTYRSFVYSSTFISLENNF